MSIITRPSSSSFFWPPESWPDGTFGDLAELEEIEHVLGLLADLALALANARPPHEQVDQMLAGLIGRRGIKIFAHRHVAELARHLEGAHHAGARAFRGAGPVEACVRPAGYGLTTASESPR